MLSRLVAQLLFRTSRRLLRVFGLPNLPRYCLSDAENIDELLPWAQEVGSSNLPARPGGTVTSG